jgi:hypothetical protein
MRLRHTVLAASILALTGASPALAGGGTKVPHHGADNYHYPDYASPHYEGPRYDGPQYDGPQYSDFAQYAAARDAWFDDCVRRGGPSGAAGALIGGVVGGIAGNRIAGRGNRTAGTIVGAGVGAVAGAAIEHGTARDRVRADCAAYLESAAYDGYDRYDGGYDGAYEADYDYDYDAGPPPLPAHAMGGHPVGGHAVAGHHVRGHAMPGDRMGGGYTVSGSGVAVATPIHAMPHYTGQRYRREDRRYVGHPMTAPGYRMPGYGPGVPVMMVPVMSFPGGQPECKETVTEIVEYVDAPSRRSKRMRRK